MFSKTDALMCGTSERVGFAAAALRSPSSHRVEKTVKSFLCYLSRFWTLSASSRGRRAKKTVPRSSSRSFLVGSVDKKYARENLTPCSEILRQTGLRLGQQSSVTSR